MSALIIIALILVVFDWANRSDAFRTPRSKTQPLDGPDFCSCAFGLPCPHTTTHPVGATTTTPNATEEP